MITAWDVYWITRLDGIGLGLPLVFITAIFVVIAWIIAMSAGSMWEDNEEKRPKYLRFLYAAIGVGALALTVGLFVPTTKEAVAIYMIPKIANNEQVQKLPDNAMKFLNGKFEEWIDDMAGKKKK